MNSSRHHLIFATLLAVLAWSTAALAVDCSQADITLSTQADIDSFQTNYGGGATCTVVTGSLVVEGAGISNLNGLSELVSVGEYLVLQEMPELTDITGLSSLESIGGGLDILWNDSLAGLQGLENLATTGGFLNIAGNVSLSDLDGLSNLESIGSLYIEDNTTLTSIAALVTLQSLDDLSIRRNSNLASLEGLESVEILEGSLVVFDNDALADLDELSNITGIGGGLEIADNDSLASIDGLSAVSYIEGAFQFYRNDSLIAIDGLHSLQHIGSSLSIRENAALEAITGLNNLEHVGFALGVVENPQLNICIGLHRAVNESDDGQQGPGPPEHPDVGGFIELRDNLHGCNGTEMIFYSVLGAVYCQNLSSHIFTTQQEVDDFAAVLTSGKGCNTVAGSVEVAGASIANVDALSGLLQIGGSLKIGGSVENLAGLSSLVRVLGSLIIQNCSELHDLEGLAGLESVDENLWVHFNSGLTSLAGLTNLKKIGGYLLIASNHELAEIQGLSSLIHVGVDVTIRFNSSLESCESLVPLLDEIDDGDLGPGPSSEGIPDIGIEASIYENLAGCNSVEQILSSVPGPIEPSISVLRTPNPLTFIASEPGTEDLTGTATINNTGNALSVLEGECGLIDADPQLTLMNSAFSIEQGAPGHVVNIACDASAAGSFTATLSCTHNGTNASSPQNYPVSCVVNEPTSPETGPQVPCGGCADRTHRPLPASGPWGDPEQDGSGFLFRVQDGTLAGFYFGYGDGGDSDWLLLNGALEPGESAGVLWQLETHLSRFTGGSCPGCEYAAPTDIEQTDIIRVEFLQKNHARFRINGGAWHYLVPVTYGNAGYAYFPESTPYLFPEMAQANGDPAPWVYFISEVQSDGSVEKWSRLVHLQPNMLLTNGDNNTLFVRSVELTPPPGENPQFDMYCSANDAVPAQSFCIINALSDELQHLFIVPFANLGANRFFGDDEQGNSIEGFRIGYD